MILSYRHKFTFLHCPKTGGSSINLALAPYLGPFDIMLGSQRERQSENLPPNLRACMDAVRSRPRTLGAILGLRPDRIGTILAAQDRYYRRQFGPIVDHPSARQVQQYDEEAWSTHFKFTFVRNPYARIASLFFYLTRKCHGPRMPFSTFLGSLSDGVGPFARWSHLMDTWEIYTIDDRIVVDFIGRHECIESDFRNLCRNLKLPYRLLSSAKAAPPYDFRELYDAESRRFVARRCERELEHFGYRFEE